MPHPVEKDRHGGNAVTVGHRDDLLDPVEEDLALRLEHEVVEIEADDVHPESGSPAELTIDRFGVEGLALPQLELVPRRRRGEVAADQPTGPFRPGMRLIRTPSSLDWCGHEISSAPVPDRTVGRVLDHDAAGREFVANPIRLGEVLAGPGFGAGRDQRVDLGIAAVTPEPSPSGPTLSPIAPARSTAVATSIAAASSPASSAALARRIVSNIVATPSGVPRSSSMAP